ncbi:MAG: diaminopimelate decarboxylase [Bacteroidetes bacterium]|nr:diaminopimelate decarboxylase [Bacteroidota bacterium]
MEKLKYERPVITKLNTGCLNKFGTKTTLTPVLQIDGVPIKKIIKEYGSPCFVLSEKTIRNTYKTAEHIFKNYYPKVQFAWSYKTNYLNAVCNIFHSEGSWAEVVSSFEFKKALANGVPGDKIIFNGPGKTKEALLLAVENNALIHIDHYDEMYVLVDLLKEIKSKARVAIRVNLDSGIYPMWDRFGFNYENGNAWTAINKIFSHPELELVGLHTHIGTYILTADAYKIASQKLSDLALKIKEKFNKNISYIDLGGGFASANSLKGAYLQGSDTIPHFEDYARSISEGLLNAGFESSELPTLFLETGRALIDDAGYLLGSVLANKRLTDGRKAIVANFGVNILFTSFWYNHKISPAQEFSYQTEDVVLYGPLCMNIDIIRENINLPLLNRGDNLVVHRIGAYNMTQWMQFIETRPNIVLIDTKGAIHLVREKEDVTIVTSQERVPEHLKNFDL